MSQPKLFTPTKVGDVTLQHRVIMAPLTRQRADENHVPTPLMVEYYAQRASTPGTLIIAEGTLIAAKAGGHPNAPGIYIEEQVAAWKRITDAVHAQKSFIYTQLWAVGRAAYTALLEAEGPYPLVSSSDVSLPESPFPPRPLSVDEIHEYVQLHVKAAENALRAGFDGVEIHCANGFLIDQFTQDTANTRTDEYGGSVENRVRFALEIVDAVSDAIGETKVAIRLSPWSEFNGMRMSDPRPTFSYFTSEVAKRHPSLAYLHVVEPRISGALDREAQEDESNDFLRDIWSPRPFIVAGGYTRETALKVAETKGDIVAFGRLFISNPDLPVRLQKNIPTSKGRRDKYYTPDRDGYTTYPFADGSVEPTRYKTEITIN